jgi:hypothetical protein
MCKPELCACQNAKCKNPRCTSQKAQCNVRRQDVIFALIPFHKCHLVGIFVLSVSSTIIVSI